MPLYAGSDLHDNNNHAEIIAGLAFERIRRMLPYRFSLTCYFLFPIFNPSQIDLLSINNSIFYPQDQLISPKKNLPFYKFCQVSLSLYIIKLSHKSMDFRSIRGLTTSVKRPIILRRQIPRLRSSRTRLCGAISTQGTESGPRSLKNQTLVLALLGDRNFLFKLQSRLRRDHFRHFRQLT